MPRLEIELGLPLNEKVDLAWQAIVMANDARFPEVMVRGNALVRMTGRGELEALNSDSLADYLSSVAAFGVDGKKGWKPVDPPRGVVNALLARDESQYVGAAFVDRVSDVPFLSADYEMVTEPGYHEPSRTLYRPAEGLADVAGEPDTTEDVQRALSLIFDDYLVDFGFSDAGSRAHALALMLLPFVRSAIPGPTPMHIIHAPDNGAGKTLLAQACLLPGCGLVPAQAAPAGRNSDDEWRKRITTLLMGGRPAVLLDNLTDKLENGALAAALTAHVWTDRILGVNGEVTLPVRNIWTATGTNLQMAGDQARRAAPIFLDPGEVKPSDRAREAFRHPDLLGWGERNRRQLVEAALTLVDHWRQGPAEVDGGYVYLRTGESPTPGRQTMGSFEGWAAVVGGILEAARQDGFLSNRSRLKAEADGKGREITEFLAAVHSLNLPSMPMAELVIALRGAEVDGQSLDLFLPTDLGSSTISREFPQKLSYWVRTNHGAWRGDFKLAEVEGHTRTHWKVVASTRAAADGVAAAVGSAAPQTDEGDTS